MKYLLIVMASMFLSTPSFAQAQGGGMGTEGGNGGDVVICSHGGKIGRPMLLDYFETRRRLTLPETENPIEKVRSILKSLENHDPIRARLYSEGLDNFFAESLFIDNIDLPNIRDEERLLLSTKHLLATNCIKKQVVIQLWNEERNENYKSWNFVKRGRYTINKSLWDQMDADNKAGLILHELLVREGINLLGLKGTYRMRKLNRYWTFGIFKKDSIESYNEKLLELDFIPLE